MLPTQPDNLIASGGYLALALLVAAEDLGLPLPGETAVIAAGAAAAAGKLSWAAVWAVATVAAIVGDNIGFAIGRFGGRPLVHRFGARLGVTEERLASAETFFRRWGGPGVFVARFVSFLRVVAAIVAGSLDMPWRVFLVWQSAGAVAWAGAMTALGYFAEGPAARALAVLKADFAQYWWLRALAIALVSAVAIWVIITYGLKRTGGFRKTPGSR